MLDNKASEVNDSKFTPELSSQTSSINMYHAPLKKSKFLKSQQVKPFSKPARSKHVVQPNKTPAATSGIGSSSTTVQSRQIKFNLTNPEQSSMLMDDESPIENKSESNYLKGKYLTFYSMDYFTIFYVNSRQKIYLPNYLPNYLLNFTSKLIKTY